jgi:electron transport complex protein RnfC
VRLLQLHLPRRIHLVQSFRMAKFEIRGLAAKQKAKEGKA